MITIASGESEAPRRNIPKAGRRFIYSLVVFYLFGSLVISVIVPSDDPGLLSAVSNEDKIAAAGPFVLGITRAGIKGLDRAINAMVSKIQRPSSAVQCGRQLDKFLVFEKRLYLLDNENNSKEAKPGRILAKQS